jgi:uncharacterized protein with PIN domain
MEVLESQNKISISKPRCLRCGRYIGKCSEKFKTVLDLTSEQNAYFCEHCQNVYVVVD